MGWFRPENRRFLLFRAVGYNAKDFLTLQATTLQIFNALADNAKKVLQKWHFLSAVPDWNRALEEPPGDELIPCR